MWKKCTFSSRNPCKISNRFGLGEKKKKQKLVITEKILVIMHSGRSYLYASIELKSGIYLDSKLERVSYPYSIKFNILNICKASKLSTIKICLKNLLYTIYYMPSVIGLRTCTFLVSRGPFLKTSIRLRSSSLFCSIIFDFYKANVRRTFILLVTFQDEHFLD